MVYIQRGKTTYVVVTTRDGTYIEIHEDKTFVRDLFISKDEYR